MFLRRQSPFCSVGPCMSLEDPHTNNRAHPCLSSKVTSYEVIITTVHRGPTAAQIATEVGTSYPLAARAFWFLICDVGLPRESANLESKGEG